MVGVVMNALPASPHQPNKQITEMIFSLFATHHISRHCIASHFNPFHSVHVLTPMATLGWVPYKFPVVPGHPQSKAWWVMKWEKVNLVHFSKSHWGDYSGLSYAFSAIILWFTKSNSLRALVPNIPAQIIMADYLEKDMWAPLNLSQSSY